MLAPLPPVPAGPPAARQELDALAVRVLVGVSAVLGTVLLVTGLLQGGPRAGLPFAAERTFFGAVLLLAAGVAQLLQRRGHARGASFGLLALWITGLHGYAAASGLGLHSLALGGSPMFIALAGMLLAPAAAVLLAVLNFGLAFALYAAELQGQLGGAALLATSTPLPYRVAVHGLLSMGGLLTALLLARLIGRGLGRALEQESRLAQLLALGADWTWELDLQGRLTALSPSFEQRTGRTVAEYLRLGQPGGPVILDDGDWPQLRAALREHRPFREMLVHYRATDGTPLTVRASGNLMRDAQGRATGWWGVSRNVSAEVQAQAELKRSKALLERLFRESPDAITVASTRDGRILLLNDSFAHITGHTEAEALGKTALELGLWRDKDTPRALRDALGANKHVHNLRSTVWTRDGQRRDMLLNVGSFDWDGEPVSVITARDITETERERAQTEAILDNASVGIALVREHRFERVNPQFERMFGLPPGSLHDAPISRVFADTTGDERFIEQADEALSSGQTLDIERHVAWPDGSRIVARIRARAVDAARPREAGTIWVAEDITERRLGEQALAEARFAAEAANQAKSAFLASMSHEIRTPLNGVLGLARLLQDPALDDARRREYLGHLVESAEGLAGLVSDVLDLSKIEAGRLQLEQLPFDLLALVESSFRSFATLGRERGLTMRCEIEPGLPRQVLGDPVRLRQILSNYLSNALKFTPAGQITLRVSRADAGHLRVDVTDSGIGIAPEARERLFQPFEQADGSTTRRFGGTGLGLSICRQLAQLMGGEVGVDSAPGQGSRFWLRLPLQAVETVPALPPPAPAPARALDGMKVLVVEDNQVNMLIITALLRALGVEPVEAQDGAEALVIARDMHAELDAVLMDLHMPVLDGLGAARALATDARTQHLPVIALSAAVLESERDQALAAGMVDFVAKPVHEAELKRALTRLMAASNAE